MFKNVKIGTQVIGIAFFLVVVAVITTSVTSIKYFKNYMEASSRRGALLALSGFNDMISEEMSRITSFRDQLAQSDRIAMFTAAGDTSALLDEIQPMTRASGIDIATVIGADGIVLARAQNPSKFGDNVGNDEDVRMALSGKTYERLMEAPSTKLGYYCGTPIRYGDNIVGMVRTAMSFEDTSLVDSVKNLFDNEATVFAGKTSINSTLMEGGKRVVGIDESDDVAEKVINKGEEYVGEVRLFGTPYLAAYKPLKDTEGETGGMIFTGLSLSEMYDTIRSMEIAIAVVSVIVLIVAFAISLLIARRISRPLNQIVALSARGGDGDLTITRDDFQYNGGGELGALVVSMSEMLGSQRDAVTQVVRTADGVMEHSVDLTRLAEENGSAMSMTQDLITEVAHLCDGNSGAVERGSAGVSEMASGAASVAKMSVESADALARTTRMSREAASSVGELVNDISSVDAAMTDNSRKMQELSQSVSEISNFMSVIASIADQTNLLALNAAIEAARAGEAGRGFAVVAEEVRKLAEESRRASQSVEDLVASLSKDASEAISSSEGSVKIVRNIMSRAGAAVDELNGALEQITNANEAIQSIAAVAEQQAASSSEISTAMDEINKSTELITQKMEELHGLSRETAAIGDSVSSSAGDMSASSEHLKDILAQFKIG
jgi:methyl-accepting chemotaxis protein